MTIDLENLGTVNKNRVELTNNGKSMLIWFSYQTAVGCSYEGKQLVRQNDWSTTTGKLLNEIDGGNKKERVDGETFNKFLAESLTDLIK